MSDLHFNSDMSLPPLFLHGLKLNRCEIWSKIAFEALLFRRSNALESKEVSK